MTLRTFMTISAIIAVPSGLVYMIAPTMLFGSSGFTLDAHGVMLARMYGVQVFGIGLLAAFVRSMEASPARRLVVRVFCAIDVLNLGMALLTVVGGYKDRSGWLDVAGFTFFAAGYGYFGFLKKEQS